MSKVVRLPDDVVELINDVKMTMLNDFENENDISYQIVNNMNNMDILRHCLRTVKAIHSEHLEIRTCFKSFSGTTTEKHVTCDGNS